MEVITLINQPIVGYENITVKQLVTAIDSESELKSYLKRELPKLVDKTPMQLVTIIGSPGFIYKPLKFEVPISYNLKVSVSPHYHKMQDDGSLVISFDLIWIYN